MNNKIIKVINFINTADLPNYMWLVAEATEKPAILLWDNEDTQRFIKKVEPDTILEGNIYVYLF